MLGHIKMFSFNHWWKGSVNIIQYLINGVRENMDTPMYIYSVTSLVFDILEDNECIIFA